MDFCSKYGLNYGFEGSDSEEISDDEETIKQLRSNKGDEGGAAEGGAAAASSQKKVMKKVRKADTNVIAVKFDELVCTYNMFAGEPIRCKSCEAIMSEISRKTISSGAGEAKTWTCEFCYVANDISAYTLDQVPTSNDVTFLIEPAPVRATAEPAAAAAGGDGAASSSDDNHLGYCIDISGSMDTMIPVKADEAATTTRAASSMTRLNGVKAACLESIENLKQTSPNKRVALLTFSDTLKYYGDSTKGAQPILCVGGGHNRFLPPPQMHFPQQQQRGFIHQVKNVFNISNVSQQQQAPILPVPVEAEIAADIMDNKEKMIALATNQDPNLKPIAQSHASLASRIKALRTEGSTALGPALAFSVGLASHKAGSQVILCTDGCANVGMGTIEGGDPTGSAEKFYEDLADYAKSRGVTVNVISMEGTDCKLALLGKVADKSNGTMNIVNPLKLGEQFKSILENRVVATGVRAKLIVNKYLYIRDEKLEAEELKAAEKNDEAAKEELRKQKKSVIEKEIGNANIDTEITFEYGVRKLSEEEKKNAPELTNVPFQLQIYYVAPDGTKAVRVYTKAQEFTTDRIKAEENLADHRAFFANAAQKESHFALESNIKCAKYKAKTNMNFATRARQAMPQQYMAQNAMMQNWSSEQRSEEMSDIMSNALYAAKKISRNKQN